jgi:hypothetical protein
VELETFIICNLKVRKEGKDRKNIGDGKAKEK